LAAGGDVGDDGDDGDDISETLLESGRLNRASSRLMVVVL
jgi:hypothetical protein